MSSTVSGLLQQAQDSFNMFLNSLTPTQRNIGIGVAIVAIIMAEEETQRGIRNVAAFVATVALRVAGFSAVEVVAGSVAAATQASNGNNGSGSFFASKSNYTCMYLNIFPPF